jgi:hypothetical protein
MIYDVKSRCLKLLDDGSGVDPWKSTTLDILVSDERRPEEVEDELCDLEALSEAHRTLSEVYSSVKTYHQSNKITGVCGRSVVQRCYLGIAQP